MLKLHQLQLIRFGHLYHMIGVPMNSVGYLIEDYKSKVASVVCLMAPACNLLANKCPLVLGQYPKSGPAALAETVFALIPLRVDSTCH